MSSGYMRANLSFITGTQRERNRLRQTLLKSYRADTHTIRESAYAYTSIHPRIRNAKCSFTMDTRVNALTIARCAIRAGRACSTKMVPVCAPVRFCTTTYTVYY